MGQFRPGDPNYPFAIPRRNIFISYYHGDLGWVQSFVQTFGTGLNKVFTPKVLGLGGEDDVIQSNKPDYVIDQIRENYISDSTVQIVLMGPCTHSRRFIDWEIKRSLTKGNGLVGIALPPDLPSAIILPNRFQENWSSYEECYARLHIYPSSAFELREWIEDAFQARMSRAHLIRNTRDTFGYNKVCGRCFITH